MGTFLRILVILATLSLVAGEPFDLLNFQYGLVSEDDLPSAAFGEQAEESSPQQYSTILEAPGSAGGSSSGPINLYADDGPSKDSKGGSSPPPSYSAQEDSPAGGSGPGPLNYPESPSEHDESGASSDSGNEQGKPSENEYQSQNDIFSDFGGDSPNSYSSGDEGSSPTFEDESSGHSPVSLTEGYKPGPPPGYEGSGSPRGNSGKGFSLFSSGFSSLFRGRRPHRPSAESSPYSSSPYLSSSPYSSSPTTDSLPMRIGKEIMGLITSASANSPISFSFSPFNFKKNGHRSPTHELSQDHSFSTHSESPSSDSYSFGPDTRSSSSDDSSSTFYLRPPSKGSSSFIRGGKAPFKRSPFSNLHTSASNNNYRSQSVRTYQQEIADAVEKQQRSQPLRSPAFLQQSIGEYTIIPNQPLISHPKTKNRLVMASRPDGSRVVLELAATPPQSHPLKSNPKKPSSGPSRSVQYSTIPQSTSSPVEFVRIPSSNSVTYTLGSRPEVPFPSLTNSHQELSTVRPVPTSSSSTSNVQYIQGQGALPRFTVTGTNSIYTSPNPQQEQSGPIYRTIQNSFVSQAQSVKPVKPVKPVSDNEGTIIYSTRDEKSS